MEVSGARDVPLLERGECGAATCATSPELRKGCFGTLAFSWLNPLIRTGYQRALEESDIYELLPVDAASTVHGKIAREWAQELQKPADRQSLAYALARAFGPTFYAAGVFKLIYDSLQMSGPYLLKALLAYVKDCEEGDCQRSEGLELVGLILISNLAQTAVLHQYFHRCFRTGMRLKAAAISLIYSKALRYNGRSSATENGERHTTTTGEIVNLMSVDSQRLQDTMPYFHVLWSGPYQIIITLIFLYFVVKWAMLAGLAVMLLQIPVVTFVTGRVKKSQKALMKMKDERVKVTNEVFSSVRLVKMYSWEDSFRAKLDALRDKELAQLRRYQLLNICSRSIWTVAPIFTGIATFSVYIFVYGDLDASTAFTALALFNVLRFPMTMFPNMVTSAVEAKLAISRIQRFLNAGEVAPRKPLPLEAGHGSVLKISGASLRWPDDGSPLLDNVELEVPAPKEGQRPHLTVVTGGVGAGKSGLLQAIIGDVEPSSGAFVVAGSMSYAPQAAWIRNATVKENILFGKEFDPALYDAVLDACCLLPDLEIMQAGDQTEIGEKGINLSGGQKARVGLARAIYAQADLLLLDDPLSAVDAHVAKKLLMTFRSKLLSRSSIVLCTHHPSALEVADQIVLLEAGAVKFSGPAADFHRNYRETVEWERALTPEAQEASTTQESGGAAKPGSSPSSSKAGSLVQREVEQTGAVPFEVYRKYIDHAGGFGLAISVGCGIVAGTALQTSADAWLSHWADHFDTLSRAVGLGGYAAFSIAAFAGVFVSNGLFMVTALKAARAFHHSLLKHMLLLPVSFYDTTPLGRVLNRFSKDIYTIDEQLQSTLFMYFQTLARVAATLSVISIATPWFLACILPLMFVYRFIQRYYIPSSRQLKRIESNLRSPVFSHFSETLDGLTTIRAFDSQGQFLEESLGKVQRNCRAYYLQVASNRWLAVRLETIGTLIVVVAGLLAVLASSRGISAGLAGLSVSYALSVTQALNWVVRMASDRETNIVSVERVTEYLGQPTEAAFATDQDVPGWPQSGEISFKDVSLRYRPDLPLVLKDVSFTIKAGEKIGIAGRTGAGKSSMMNCLLRLTELAGGHIFIDGLDIGKMGLRTLRRSMAIIPQEPVMFAGTVRFNMDPVGVSDDKEVWEALRRCHLEGHIKELAGGLDASVTERGQNFSMGQRQMACLGRALLRPSKILLLDEATAAVDMDTDALIQGTIRTEFSSRTVLCIAHRISTITDSDRVLVLTAGSVAEFAAPQQLLADEKSLFHALAAEDSKRR